MEHGPTEPRRVTIEGVVYELAPWSIDDGRRWLYRIARLVMPALSSGIAGAALGNDEKAKAARVAAAAGVLGAVLESLDEATFISFADTCEKYTRVVSRDQNGEERVQELTAIRQVYMRGRYFELVELMRAHLQEQYADFFGRLVRQLAQHSANEAK